MTVNNENFKDSSDVKRSIDDLSTGKLDAIVHSTRAPVSTDKASYWLHESGVATIVFYVRHSKNGNWIAI